MYHALFTRVLLTMKRSYIGTLPDELCREIYKHVFESCLLEIESIDYCYGSYMWLNGGKTANGWSCLADYRSLRPLFYWPY